MTSLTVVFIPKGVRESVILLFDLFQVVHCSEKSEKAHPMRLPAQKTVGGWLQIYLRQRDLL
jgi:hypothetical protein